MRGIVTGASRGLGLALTRALSERGWQLAVDARGAEALEHAVAGLSGVIAVTGDVADPDQRHRLVEAAGEPIDLLVNNASLLGPSPLALLARYPLEELRSVYEANVLAPRARASGGRWGGSAPSAATTPRASTATAGTSSVTASSSFPEPPSRIANRLTKGAMR